MGGRLIIGKLIKLFVFVRHRAAFDFENIGLRLLPPFPFFCSDCKGWRREQYDSRATDDRPAWRGTWRRMDPSSDTNRLLETFSIFKTPSCSLLFKTTQSSWEFVSQQIVTQYLLCISGEKGTGLRAEADTLTHCLLSSQRNTRANRNIPTRISKIRQLVSNLKSLK